MISKLAVDILATAVPAVVAVAAAVTVPVYPTKKAPPVTAAPANAQTIA